MIRNEVYWHGSGARADGEPLDKDISAEVAIVGGGMAGLMAAQTLAESGRSVVLIERDFCGAGASGRSSGFITPDSEIELSSLLSAYGPEKAKAIWEFVLSGVESIRRNIISYKIECDYQVQDSLFIANSASTEKHPRAEHGARQTLGYHSLFYEQRELPPVIGSDGYRAAVRYPDTFGINSYQYCQAMKKILIEKGVRIYENTPALSVESAGVKTPKAFMHADNIIVATDRFIPELGKLSDQIYHVQTFLGISQPLSEENAKAIFPENKLMVWDTDLVYNYFRMTGGNRLLVGGGDLRYTYARNYAEKCERFARRLTSYLRQKFPSLSIELECLWPGMLGVSKDLLPVMGAEDGRPNVWYTGAATGLPWAAALGRYAAERLLVGRDDFDRLFSFKRNFLIGPRVEHLITTPATYAISHGIAKYWK